MCFFASLGNCRDDSTILPRKSLAKFAGFNTRFNRPSLTLIVSKKYFLQTEIFPFLERNNYLKLKFLGEPFSSVGRRRSTILRSTAS